MSPHLVITVRYTIFAMKDRLMSLGGARVLERGDNLWLRWILPLLVVALMADAAVFTFAISINLLAS